MTDNKKAPEELEILIDPAPELRVVSSPVTEFDENLQHVIQSMHLTMINAHGVGLAAPQVGIQKRIIVMEIPGNEPQYFVNPEIIATTGSQQQREGCLSVPNTVLKIIRHKGVRVKFQDAFGEELIKEFSGMEAVCVQHEIDHLNGKLFTDYMRNNKNARYI